MALILLSTIEGDSLAVTAVSFANEIPLQIIS